MILIGNANAPSSPRRPRIIRDGSTAYRTDLIETSLTSGISPQAYIIEQAPGQCLGPHFHFNDQFQVVVGGSGQIGRRDVTSGSVHYAAGHTGYGPLTPTKDGLRYMTLRLHTEHGANYLPESRERMARVARINVHGERTSCAAPVKHATWTRLIPTQLNRAEAWQVLMPIDATFIPPVAGNRFYLVVEGVVEFQSARLEPTSCVFISSGHACATPIICKSPQAKVYVLQFDALNE